MYNDNFEGFYNNDFEGLYNNSPEKEKKVSKIEKNTDNYNNDDVGFKNSEMELISIPQATRIIGGKRETIEEWLKDPELGRIYVGSSCQVRFIRYEFVKYVKNRAKNWYKFQ
ncbi:hypothetical protein [Liquorilactobacillus hordei]|uniref:hypothetical protein n=1 Tax=Liquorilactobacillus hordei TaxID=468911 RepID=UPI0039EB6D17